jgi:hypothetical protein
MEEDDKAVAPRMQAEPPKLLDNMNHKMTVADSLLQGRGAIPSQRYLDYTK